MESILETLRALYYFLGINVIFFIICVAVLAIKIYFNVSLVPMETVLRIILIWPQP